MAENPEETDKPALSPSPRRGHVGPERPAEADQRDQIASLANSVKLLASQLSATKGFEPSPEAPERTVRRKQKFQRAVNPNDPRAEAAGVAEAASADEAVAEDQIIPSDDPREEDLDEQESLEAAV